MTALAVVGGVGLLYVATDAEDDRVRVEHQVLDLRPGGLAWPVAVAHQCRTSWSGVVSGEARCVRCGIGARVPVTGQHADPEVLPCGCGPPVWIVDCRSFRPVIVPQPDHHTEQPGEQP